VTSRDQTAEAVRDKGEAVSELEAALCDYITLEAGGQRRSERGVVGYQKRWKA